MEDRMVKNIFINGLIIMIAICSLHCKKDESIKPANAIIVLAQGVVSINNIQAHTGVSLHYGDVIKTGDDGICRIQIGDRNVLQIGKSSELVFNISDTGNELLLNQGWLGGVTRKIFTSGGKYLVKTPTVVASIRGTSFCVVATSAEKSYFCVCNGSINLMGSSMEKGEDVTAAHHKGLWFKKDKNGNVVVKEAGLLFHDDKGIEELAASINQTIDWTKPDTY